MKNDNGSWSQQTKLTAEDGVAYDYGSATASRSDGDHAVVGAYSQRRRRRCNSGSAYIFVKNDNGTWSQQAKLTANDGAANDSLRQQRLDLDGDHAVVGARMATTTTAADSGSAYIFVNDGNGNWSQQAKLTANDAAAGDYFGWSVSIAGDHAVVGAYSQRRQRQQFGQCLHLREE